MNEERASSAEGQTTGRPTEDATTATTSSELVVELTPHQWMGKCANILRNSAPPRLEDQWRSAMKRGADRDAIILSYQIRFATIIRPIYQSGVDPMLALRIRVELMELNNVLFAEEWPDFAVVKKLIEAMMEVERL